MKRLFSFFLTMFLAIGTLHTQPPSDKSFDTFLEELIKDIEKEEVKQKKTRPLPPKPVITEKAEEEVGVGDEKKDPRTLFLESIKSKEQKLSTYKKDVLYEFTRELALVFASLRKKVVSLDAYNRTKFEPYGQILSDIETLLGVVLDEEEHLKSLAAKEHEGFRSAILNFYLPNLQRLNLEIETEAYDTDISLLGLTFITNKFLLAQNSNEPVLDGKVKTESTYEKYILAPVSKIWDSLLGTWNYIKSFFVKPEEKPAVKKPEPFEEALLPQEPVSQPGVEKPEITRRRETSEREKRLEELVSIKYSTLTKMALRKLRNFFDMELLALKNNLEKVIQASGTGIEEKRKAREAEVKKAQERQKVIDRPSPYYAGTPYRAPQPYYGPPASVWPGTTSRGRFGGRGRATLPSGRTPSASKQSRPTKKGTPTKPSESGYSEDEDKGTATRGSDKENLFGKENRLRETIIDRVNEVENLIKEGDNGAAVNTIREIDRLIQELARVIKKLDTTKAYKAQKKEKRWIEKERNYQEALQKLEIQRKLVGAPKQTKADASDKVKQEEERLRSQQQKELFAKLGTTARFMLETDEKIQALKSVEHLIRDEDSIPKSEVLTGILNKIRDLNNISHFIELGTTTDEAVGAAISQYNHIVDLVRNLPRETFGVFQESAKLQTTTAAEKEAMSKLQELKNISNQIG